MSESFEEAVKRFQAFLFENGRPTELVGLTAGDVLLSGGSVVYVKTPSSKAIESEGHRAFELGMGQGMGVIIKGLFELGHAMCVHVWTPSDRAAAESAMLPPGVVKLSIPSGDFRVTGRAVPNRLRWVSLQLLHRRKQALQRQLRLNSIY